MRVFADIFYSRFHIVFGDCFKMQGGIIIFYYLLVRNGEVD